MKTINHLGHILNNLYDGEYYFECSKCGLLCLVIKDYIYNVSIKPINNNMLVITCDEQIIKNIIE